MRRIKSIKILTVIALIWSMFSFITPVYAAASATVGFSGNSTVAVGNNITIKMYVSNVTDTDGGVVSVGGNLSFDSEYLEYVSGTGATTPYSFQINTNANYIIAGLDTSLSSGITGSSQTTVFTFVFKALKEGTTQITLTNAKLSDTSSKITTVVSPKTITIGASTPAKSNDATLKSLGATGYTLSPSFSSGTTSYTVNVPSGTTSVTLTGAANDSKATVAGLGKVTLTGDATTATVKVTAEDGTTTKTYTVKINREKATEPETPTKSSDATLKSLSASGYTLSPSFSSNTTSYTVKVPSSATTVKLDGAANDSKATVTGLGDITLTGDTTTATVKVTAEDGVTTKTYTVKIEKEKESTGTVEKDSDATLKSLDVSGYTLTPIFNKDINTYSIKVKNSVTGLDITAIPNSDKATVTITGNKGWQEGNNVVTIKVTAEDGSTNTYTVNVTREASTSTGTVPDTKSSNNYLKELTIKSSHEMDKTFNKDISVYNVTVPYEVNELDLSAIASDPKAKVEITGNKDFKVGAVNIVEIKVTAEDGSIRIYTINVTRSTEDSENDLDDIIIGGGVTISPEFDPDNTHYTTTVDGDTDKLDINAIPKDNGSTVEIIGNENLKEGKNTVLIKVTDKNGFSKYYTIEVEKEAKSTTILGLTPFQLAVMAGIIGSLLLLFVILLRKKKDDKEEKQYHTPIIEVKPEFNFGSKNTSDDDIVHGNLNQNSEVKEEREYELPEPKTIAIEADYEENIPYDPYDETVTKRELIDAIHEATKTKDPSKLKMLLEQDALNQKKKEIKKREEESKNSDDWR